MKAFRSITALFFIFLWGITGYAISTLKSGRLKIYFDKPTARFSAAYEAYDTYVPILFYRPKYPITSYLTIRIDGRSYIFGGARGNLTVTQSTDGKIVAKWRYKQVEVVQTLKPKKELVYVSIVLKNVGSRRTTVGARYLLDVNADTTGFYVDKGDFIDGEDLLEQSDYYRKIYFWASASRKNPVLAAIDFPDKARPKVVFSNWLKAYCNSWDFPLYSGQGFRYKSVLYPDAGISIYWDTRTLKPGERQTIDFWVGVPEPNKKILDYAVVLNDVYEAREKGKIVSAVFVANRLNRPLGPTILNFDFERNIGVPETTNSLFFSGVSDTQPLFVTWRYKGERFGYHKYRTKMSAVLDGEKHEVQLTGRFDYLPPYYADILRLKNGAKSDFQVAKSASTGFPELSGLRDLEKQLKRIEEFLREEKFKHAYNLAQNAHSLSVRLKKEALHRQKRYKELQRLVEKYEKSSNLEKLKDVYSEMYEIKGNDEYLLKKLNAVNRALRIKQLYSAANDFMLYKSYEQARQVYRDIISLNPKEAEAYYNIGLSYFEENNYDSAIYYFKKNIELAPKSYLAYYQLARAYIYKHDPKAAREYILKVLSLKPDYAPAEELLKSLK